MYMYDIIQVDLEYNKGLSTFLKKSFLSQHLEIKLAIEIDKMVYRIMKRFCDID